MTRTVADLLAECLRELGVGRIWGSPVQGLDVVEVDDSDLACLMADADGRLGESYGAAAVPGRILHLSSKPGGTAAPRSLGSAEELVAACAELAGRDFPDTVALHLDLDLDAPAPDEVVARRDDSEALVMTLDPAMADLDLVVLAGPGVVRGGHAEGLDRLVRSGGFMVAESFGARGLMRWDRPFAAGVVGLQARDAELSGMLAADLVVATGIDPDETPLATLGRFVQEVPAWQLPALTARWDRTPPAPEAAPQREAFAPVLVPGYESESSPLHPARAALHLTGAAPDGGLVAGEAGPAGFWLARAAPTGVPGSVVVPSLRQPGAAVALGLAARSAGRPAIAVVDRLDGTAEAVLDLARRAGVGLEVQLWSPDGSRIDAANHAMVTGSAFRTERVVVRSVAVATEELGPIVDVAGPVVAWGGLDS